MLENLSIFILYKYFENSYALSVVLVDIFFVFT